MASKSLFESNPLLTLGAIVILAVAADAVAARRGGGGGGHDGGGGGGYHRGERGSDGGGLRSGAPLHSGAFRAHAGTAVRSGEANVPVNAPANLHVNVPANGHRGAAVHGDIARHRFNHGGLGAYSYDGCYRGRRVGMPFGWTRRRANISLADDGRN